MKRILILLITMVLLLAAVPALGDEPDPIIGTWYAVHTSGGVQLISIYIFDASGKVTTMMLDVEESGYDNAGSVLPIPSGKWSHVMGNTYIVTGTEVGISRANVYLDGDDLYAPATKDSYWVYHRMAPTTKHLTNYEMQTLAPTLGR